MVRLRKIGKIIAESLIYFQKFVIILLGIVFLLLMVTSVIGRHFIETPILFVEEVILLMIFWYYILGAAHNAYERSHIGGGIVAAVIKNPRHREYIGLGGMVISTVLSCLFAIWGYDNFLFNVKVDPHSLMLRFPLKYSFLSLFVGFSLLTFYLLVDVVARVRHLRQSPERK